MKFNSVHNASSTPEVFFDTLFKDTYPNTIAYLKKICENKELAEDLAQEAYLKVWQKLDLLPESDEEILRYILVISRNCFLDHLKSTARQKKQQEAFTTIYVATTPAASSHIEAKEQLEIVDITINEHKEAARRYYLLNREEGLTYKEIARQEGVSEKTVERYIGGVLRSLRSRLATMMFFW
jgi:RNA polymerase sigma factor (sigma-70 family)